jgi:hypothetical protein
VEADILVETLILPEQEEQVSLVVEILTAVAGTVETAAHLLAEAELSAVEILAEAAAVAAIQKAAAAVAAINV